MFDQGADILLVEDNADDEALSLLGFGRQNLSNVVHVVRDGDEALAYLFCTGAYANRRFENPKVILLDLRLPNVDGIEVLRQIRSDPRTRLVPVVVLSASSEECDIDESYRQGANSYIVKPTNSEQHNELAQHVGLYWLRLNRQPAFASGLSSTAIPTVVST